jgi:hypothetical protein
MDVSTVAAYGIPNAGIGKTESAPGLCSSIRSH